MEKLKSILESKKNPRILDIGTGRGNYIQLIAHLTDDFEKIVGIDTVEGAVKAAQSSFDDDRISFIKMDAKHMTFEDESFDIVCLSNSLHHLEDVEAIVKEMERVLAKDGYLIFSEMYSDVTAEKQKTHVDMHHFWAEIDRMNDVCHNETMKRSEILKLVEDVSACTTKDSWDMDYGSDDDQELSEEQYKFLYGSLDKSLERVKESPEYGRLESRAKELQDRLKNVGFESAAQLAVVMEKS